MAQPTIEFEGKDKVRLVGADLSTVYAVSQVVQGINVSKDKTAVRATRDEMTVYYLMKHANATPSKEVYDWLVECKGKRETLAHLISEPRNIPHDKIRLYPFQTSDVSFMTYAMRCINGNEPGIGKTIEAIAACDLIEAKKILVICQKSLMYMWADEFRKWSYGDISVCEESSSYKKQEKLRVKIDANSRVKVISYSLLEPLKWPQLFKEHWDVVIADEAHYLKNPDSNRSKAAIKLKTEHLWLLTGTPDPNGDIGEIFGMLHMLDPNRFKSKWDFCYRYGDVEETDVYIGGRIITNKKVRGVREDAKAVFHRMLAPYMFMRKKKDVYKDLPDKIYKTIPIELSAYERKLYDNLFNDMVTRIQEDQWLVTKNAMDLNSKLRQLLLNPTLIGAKDESTKTQAILDLVESIPGQIVLFCWYKDYIKYLHELFNQQGISNQYIIGGTPAEMARANEVAFQKGQFKIIMGTYSKMSEGFNFQNAHTLIQVDKSYIPKDNKQAEDRIHRPGQTNNPLIISLMARNSIDEVVQEVLDRKQSSIEEIETFQYMIDALRNPISV